MLQVQSLKDDVEKMTKDVQVKEKDIEDKTKTITQVRRLSACPLYILAVVWCKHNFC